MEISSNVKSLCQNEEESVFCSRIAGYFSAAEQKGFIRCSFFLNERQIFLADRIRESLGASGVFFGGYAGAVRQILCALPSWMSEDTLEEGELPIVPVTFTYRRADSLSHRDFLGALMSLQIKREMIGDILPGEGQCVLFAHENAAALILSEISLIGRVGVRAEQGFHPDAITPPRFEEQEITVASLRLDAVVAALIGRGRESAASLVRGGGAQLNYVGNIPGSRQVSEGDVLSVRGYGKYRIAGLLGETRRGRMKLQIFKYS